MENDNSKAKSSAEAPKTKKEQVLHRNATKTVKKNVSLIVWTIGLAIFIPMLSSHPVAANLIALATLSGILYYVYLFIPQRILRVKYQRKRIKAIYGLIIAIAIAATVWHVLANRSLSTMPNSETTMSVANPVDTPKTSASLSPQETNTNQNHASRLDSSLLNKQHGRPLISKEAIVNPTSTALDNHLSDFQVLENTDHFAEIEVSYYYNGSDGTDDINITLFPIHADGSRFNMGVSFKIDRIGRKGIARFNYSYEGTGDNSTLAELCMEQNMKQFHCQRFPLVKTWRPHKLNSN